MAMRKSRLYRLTARLLVLSFVANPCSFAELPVAAATRNSVAADLRTAAPSGGLALPSPAAAAPTGASVITQGGPRDPGRARHRAAASSVAPLSGTASASAGDATCAESLTQHHAPLVSLARTLLWPPSHPMVDVGLGVDVTPPCEGRVTTRLAVFADEPDEDQTGDGNLPGDARLDGTTLYLRAERKGNGDGRVYLLVTEATDSSGNRGFGCCTVAVPHSAAPAALLSVQAQAAAARAFCRANAGTPPAGYFVVGDDPQQ